MQYYHVISDFSLTCKYHVTTKPTITTQHTGWFNGKAYVGKLGSYLVRVSLNTPAIVTDGFLCFPLSLYVNVPVIS